MPGNVLIWKRGSASQPDVVEVTQAEVRYTFTTGIAVAVDSAHFDALSTKLTTTWPASTVTAGNLG
jgi:hypothetical protein